MRIVVAGGTGLIGRRFIQTLRSDRHDILLLTRSPRDGAPQVHDSRVIPWDPPSGGAWEQEVRQADAVVNLAGASVGGGWWSRRRKELIRLSRVHTTRALVGAMAASRQPNRVLLNVSAVGYYGHVPEGDVTEDHPPGTDFLADVCREWEAAAREAGRSGIRVVVPRIGFVLAPEAPAFRKMLLPFRLSAGGWFGDGRQWFPWVHIDDVVGALRSLLTRENQSGPFNVTAPGIVRMREFCKILAGVLNRPCWAPVPALVLRGVLGQMADLLLKGQRAIPSRLLEGGYEFRFPALEEALLDVTGGQIRRWESGSADGSPAPR